MINVIIPNYNRKDLLESCLDSLRAQTYREFEVVVVDNSSTDGSAEMVGAKFPEARVVRLPVNRGFSGAVNVGIRASSGELVALINNDADADPAWLAELYKAASANPEAGFFASKMLFYDHRDIIDTVADGFTVAGFGYKRGWGEKDAGLYDGLTYVFGACGGGAMYRREMLEKLKVGEEYFDEDYFAFGEDVDISFRAQSQGYKCLAVPAARVYHRVRATAGVSSTMPIYLGNRNSMSTVFKNFPRPVLFKHLLSLVAFWMLSVIVDIVKTGNFTVLKAYYDMYIKRQEIKKKREEAASKRVISDREFDALLDRGWLKIWARTGLKTARVRKILNAQSTGAHT